MVARQWYTDIEMHSTNNEGKSIAAERFIRNLKNKNCKHMTSISKNVYFDKLDDIVNEHNNAYHTTIKMKSIQSRVPILTLVQKIMIKILNLKLVIMW